jgi:16S rRNA (guanine527-N7)-methyltransferase
MRIDSEEWKTYLIDGAAAMGISLSASQADRLSVHGTELLSWNRKMNLTTITAPDEVAVKHFLDSLAPVPLIPPGSKLLDIGSGGGFPGVPLKIAIPSLSVVLIDASRKKVSFLKYLIRTLRLTGIEARQIRSEDFASRKGDHGEDSEETPRPRFDVVISRALTSLERFARVSLPLLAENGIIVAMKGPADRSDPDTDGPGISGFSDAEAAGWVRQTSHYRLPRLGIERSLVCLRPRADAPAGTIP